MMALYKHTAEVICSYNFPIDMLRYDRCYPDTTAAASRLTDAMRRDHRDAHAENFPIELSKYDTCKDTSVQWTIGRWNSFGCAIGSFRVVKLS